MKNWPWYGHLIVAVLIFVMAFFFYFKPKNAELTTLRSERVRLVQEVEVLKQKKKELNKIEAQITAMTATLKDLEQIIPLRKEISAILRQVQNLVYDSKLEMVNFTPQGEISKDFYSEWPIPIQITGNYHNLAFFFDRLSRFDRLFIIDKFTIHAVGNQTDLTTIGADFTAKTFFFNKEPAAAAPAQGRRP